MIPVHRIAPDLIEFCMNSTAAVLRVLRWLGIRDIVAVSFL
jgi:hypothetical protein